MTEMTQYLEDYDVPRSRHAITVAHFLKDKAWTYYVSSMSRRPREWSLKRLFKGLFNVCFPLNHRTRS